MKGWVLPVLIAGALAGMIGFGIGRRTAGRRPESGASASPASKTGPGHTKEKYKGLVIGGSESEVLPESSNPSSIPAKSGPTGQDRLVGMILPFLSEKNKNDAL